jgi:hypothetical protein
VIIGSSCSSRGGRLDPGGGFSSLGDETSICTIIAAAIFVHSIPSGNKGIGMSLFERKGQLTLLFGSYSRKSKKSGVNWAQKKNYKEKLLIAISTYDLYFLIIITKDIFGIIGIQIDNTIILGDK